MRLRVIRSCTILMELVTDMKRPGGSSAFSLSGKMDVVISLVVCLTFCRTPFFFSGFSLGFFAERFPTISVFRLTAITTSAPSARQAETGPGADLSAALVFSTDADRVPESLRMSFKPRTWSDLDGWEKAGFVLRQTSAVAGAAYLLSELLD